MKVSKKSVSVVYMHKHQEMNDESTDVFPVLGLTGDKMFCQEIIFSCVNLRIKRFWQERIVFCLLKAVLQHLSYSHIHTLMEEAAMQAANRSSGAIQRSVSYQGHFNMQLGRAGIRTSALPITR